MRKLGKAVMLAGPTASGKTAAALALARRFPIEIISVDSTQVFRGLDIGSAKPEREVLQSVPHHLIDIRDPEETYSAAEFTKDALRLMHEIRGRGAIPLLSGGTNLYYRALAGDLQVLPDSNDNVRASIEADAKARGWPAIHQDLQAVDPQSAARIGPNDRQRIQRALEVYRVSGRSMTAWHQDAAPLADTSEWAYLWLALMPADRAALHARIAHRLDDMFAAGLLDEVASLRQRPGLMRDMPSVRSVGYRQLWHHLDGDYDLETAREKALAATRQLAKRQLTWLRNDHRYQFVEPLDKARDDRISATVEEFFA